jgi:hypothetical protein
MPDSTTSTADDGVVYEGLFARLPFVRKVVEMRGRREFSIELYGIEVLAIIAVYEMIKYIVT